MNGTGRAPKTNLGGELHRSGFNVDAGNPNLDDVREATATVSDIRMPGEFYNREGSGILVRLEFDEKEYSTDAWIPLRNSYQQVRSLFGNRQAILKNPPRVVVTFHVSRLEDGYAELICDNKQEASFSSYERNPSALYVNILTGLAGGVRAPG